MIRYLVTRPEHDDTTYYLSCWCESTIRLADKQGIEPIDLLRGKANAKEVESRLKKLNPKLVMLNGHGSKDVVAGHKDQPLIVAGKNEKLLKDKIVYALSCKSAEGLGPLAVKSGAVSYTGYTDDFIFMFEPESISRTLKDKTAKMFLEPSVLFISNLIKGKSVEESREKSKNLLRENFVKSMSGESKDTDVTRFLWWNLRHFKSHGDLTATI